jgi:hypothetical protein
MDQISSSGQRLPRSITDLLHEKITNFVNRNIAVGGEPSYQAEFAQLKIENDMVNTFFDEIHKMSDHFTFNFVESLKQDLENIMQILNLGATECGTFYTFLTVMLRRLSPNEGAFTSTLMLCK